MIFIMRLAKNVNKFILFLWRSLEKQQYTRPRKKDIVQTYFSLILKKVTLCFIQSQQQNMYATCNPIFVFTSGISKQISLRHFLIFFLSDLIGSRQLIVLTCSSTSNGLVFQKVKLGQWVPFLGSFRFQHSSTSVCRSKKVI